MNYILKRSNRARALRLMVYPDARVVVTAPRFFGMGTIERFVAKHSDWVRRKVAQTNGRTVIRIRRNEIAMLKHRALALASVRSQYFSNMYGFKYNKITIRAQKSRWGSCSHRGNLSFNYKLAALPANMADYIIVHELCHLREMNHSQKFWELVARTVPGHKEVRKDLRALAILFD